MIKNITTAFGRPFNKNGGRELPISTKHALTGTTGSLSRHELRLLVAGMVD